MPTFDPTRIDKVASFANTPSTSYRSNTMRMTDVPNLVGAGAGASVATAVSFSPSLPVNATNITVIVTPNQDAVPFVTLKTVTGFTFTLNPRLAANTLAVGTNDIVVKWDE